MPAGQRKQYDMDYDVLDSNDGRYKITYYLKTPGRWELSLAMSFIGGQSGQFICRTPCQCGQAGAAAAGGSYVSTPESGIHSLVGGSSFLVVVRPKITRDMSASEAVAAMEAHARMKRHSLVRHSPSIRGVPAIWTVTSRLSAALTA